MLLFVNTLAAIIQENTTYLRKTLTLAWLNRGNHLKMKSYSAQFKPNVKSSTSLQRPVYRAWRFGEGKTNHAPQRIYGSSYRPGQLTLFTITMNLFCRHVKIASTTKLVNTAGVNCHTSTSAHARRSVACSFTSNWRLRDRKQKEDTLANKWVCNRSSPSSIPWHHIIHLFLTTKHWRKQAFKSAWYSDLTNDDQNHALLILLSPSQRV